MAILKKDLAALGKDFKALEKKMAKLLKAFETSSKPKKVSKPEPAKKAAAKKTTAKKTAAPKAPAKKKAVKKAPAKKKAVQVTATDQILKIIKRSKKGVDVPTLKTKTGFDDKKVRNIVFRAAKEGRIKKSGRGFYVGG
jgi:FKBP-type peptidyl-prolyl cis-trans isomerase